VTSFKIQVYLQRLKQWVPCTGRKNHFCTLTNKNCAQGWSGKSAQEY